MAVNSRIYAIKITDKRTYLWRGRENTYKGIESPLGIKSYKPGEKLPDNGVFESDEKPPRINIRTTKGGSYVRFIDADKLTEQVHERKLIGKKIKNAKGKDETICYVSIKSN